MEYDLKKSFIPFKDIDFPPTLYKYRFWSNKYHREIISKRQVFFSPPSEFEDKLDCKIPTRWDLLTYNDILNFYWKDSLRELGSNASVESRIEFSIHHANNTNVTNPDIVKIHQEDTFRQFNDRYGILSLTPFNNLPRLWEKYGDKHKGFCIGYQPHHMLKGIGTGFGKVTYVKELPIIYPSIKMPFEIQFATQMYWKLDNWTFEQEFRTYKSVDGTLSLEQRIQEIKPEAIKEIIFGAKMSQEDIDELIQIIPKELVHVKLKIAILTGEMVNIVDYVIS